MPGSRNLVKRIENFEKFHPKWYFFKIPNNFSGYRASLEYSLIKLVSERISGFKLEIQKIEFFKSMKVPVPAFILSWFRLILNTTSLTYQLKRVAYEICLVFTPIYFIEL